jgi:hypothetical protein
MSAFHLKMIAAITMVVDHIGVFFFPQFVILRIIGRLSFPIFCWFIANGARYSKDMKQYLLRMITLAVVSQVPFFFANRLIDPNFFLLNAVFTLSIGLGAIILIKRTNDRFLWVLVSFVAFCLAEIFFTDYGGPGVLSIVAFYLFSQNIKAMIASQVFIYGVLFSLPAINDILTHSVTQKTFVTFYEVFGLGSLIFIALYNGEQGPKMKYLFYVLYPLQYVVFYILLTIYR